MYLLEISYYCELIRSLTWDVTRVTSCTITRVYYVVDAMTPITKVRAPGVL